MLPTKCMRSPCQKVKNTIKLVIPKVTRPLPKACPALKTISNTALVAKKKNNIEESSADYCNPNSKKGVFKFNLPQELRTTSKTLEE